MAILALPAGAQPLADQVSEKVQAVWYKVQPYAKVSAGRRAQGFGFFAALNPAQAFLDRSGAFQLTPCSLRQRPPANAVAAARPPGHPPRRRRPAHPPAAFLVPDLQIALHYGYIPAIIAVGMFTTEPRPSWVQLLGPM